MASYSISSWLIVAGILEARETKLPIGTRMYLRKQDMDYWMLSQSSSEVASKPQSRFWRQRLQVARDNHAVKTALFVRAIAEWLVRGLTASAERNVGPAVQAEGASL